MTVFVEQPLASLRSAKNIFNLIPALIRYQLTSCKIVPQHLISCQIFVLSVHPSFWAYPVIQQHWCLKSINIVFARVILPFLEILVVFTPRIDAQKLKHETLYDTKEKAFIQGSFAGNCTLFWSPFEQNKKDLSHTLLPFVMKSNFLLDHPQTTFNIKVIVLSKITNQI